MKRRDFCKALVCSAALAPGLALPRAEAAAKSQTVGRAVTAGNYTMSFRSELSQMDIEHEYYYSDSFFAHSSIQYDHQLALATLGMVTAAFNTWASDAKYWANGDVGRENSLDAAYTKLGFADVKYRYYDVDVGKAGDFVGWSTARKTIILNGKRTTIVALILRGGGYGGEWVSNLHTGTGHAHSGFIIPVHEVFADLKNYLAAAQQKGELGVVKLWMGGYSRGAAVANLLAARVNKELPGLERENVFVYTFATPVALGPQDYPNLQQDYDNNHNADGSLKESWGESNIFNIISSGDIVPHLLPEEWSFPRNGNDRFLPSTRNEEELEDLNEMGKNDFGPTPLDFSWLATDKETDEVMLRMEEYFISRENYHEKYEAALMDMTQCAFIRSEEEVTQNKVLDDGEVIQRLRTLTHLKNMDYWKISRAVWAASTMRRAVLKRVDAENIPIRAQQIVVPILAVGLCYDLESEAVSLIAKYILMFVAMKSAPDDAIRAAFCHHCENYIALMEYYDTSEHSMIAPPRPCPPPPRRPPPAPGVERPRRRFFHAQNFFALARNDILRVR